MTGLYHDDGMIGKLFQFFSQIFGKVSFPALRHLPDLCVSVLSLNSFQSVKFNFEHFISENATYQLKSLYYTFNESHVDPDIWLENLLRLILHMPNVDQKTALVLSVDDTMVAKHGEHFACRTRMFDHARHNGETYLDGHCFVCLMLSVPLWEDNSVRYVHVPPAYRMWVKDEKSKLETAAQLIRTAMNVIGSERAVCLCCDSWYPRGCVAELVNEFPDLSIICNVRSDTVLYALPPERTGKRGRPGKRGERLHPESFPLTDVEGTDFCAGHRKVLTNLFGEREVEAIVTRSKKTDSWRVFLCTTNPEEIPFDSSVFSDRASTYVRCAGQLLPLSIYSFRWEIEVCFYEQKRFWGLKEYKLRSRTGIERLVNLLTVVYASMSVLPWWNPAFSDLKDSSPQQVRFVLGNAIHYQTFFAAFGEIPKVLKNYPNLSKTLADWAVTLLSTA